MSKSTEKRPTGPELARHFDVSVRTIADWKASGCPTDTAGAVAAWRMERDAKRECLKLSGGLDELIRLTSQLEDRRFGLTKRIEGVNALPADMPSEPGVIKAAICAVLTLEQGLLGIPARIINDPTSATLPARLVRAVLDVLDEMDVGE